MNDISINRILNQNCLDSILSITKEKFCPAYLMRNDIFSWKNEIIFRRTSITVSSTKESPSLVALNSLTNDRNFSSVTSLQKIKYLHVDDIYLLLISVSLINFFISLIVPIIFIRKNKQNKKLIIDELLTGNFKTRQESSDNSNEISESESTKFIGTKVS